MKTISFEQCLNILSPDAQKAFKNFMRGKTVVLDDNNMARIHQSDWDNFLNDKNWSEWLK
jgi:hypothetical protein